MPKIKIIVDNNEYTLECEAGEEQELNNAVQIVNDKMLIFKDETEIKKTTKLLMVSLLLASEINESKKGNEDENKKLKEVEFLLEKLQSLI